MTRRISARLACTGKCAGRNPCACLDGHAAPCICRDPACRCHSAANYRLALDFRRMVYVRDDGPDGVLRMEIR